MEILEKLQQRLKELEEFAKLAPQPVEVRVNNKVYAVKPPTLWVVNNVEKKFTDISAKRLKAAQDLSKNKNTDVAELLALFYQHIDAAAEIVQIILDGKPTDQHVVDLEELKTEWSVIDLVKVFKAYEYLLDVADFFQTFRIPVARM